VLRGSKYRRNSQEIHKKGVKISITILNVSGN